ncbi:MAG TPA: rRNA maturation RNase YbeY [Candidatus Paceibacterota bacterium]|nr:rRNA maturation RNase YbeY [Candidatus Paceibacterota bacterium]
MGKIKIEINNLTRKKIILGFLKKVAEQILSLNKLGIKNLKKFSELSVAVVGDKEMIKLNKKHRNRNYTTDVLAFDYGLQFGGQGEIIICLDQAKRQAKELNNVLKEELSILLVHGMLHLAGYDDKTKKDFNKMLKKQKEVWQKIIL